MRIPIGLRLKTATAVTAIFVMLLAGIYILFSEVVLSEFSSIEQGQAEIHLTRVVEGVRSIQDDLESRAVEWSTIVTKSLRMVDVSTLALNEVFNEPPFDVRDVVVSTTQGEILFAGRLNPHTRSLDVMPHAAADSLLRSVGIVGMLQDPQAHRTSGLTGIDGQPTFFAFAKSSGDKVRADDVALFLTRDFSPRLQSNLVKQLRINPSFESIDPSIKSETIKFDGTHTTLVTTKTNIQAARTITDIVGAPLLRITIDMPRQVHAQGVAAMNHIMLLVAISLVFSNAIVLLFLNRSVIIPIQRLCHVIMEVARTSDFSLRASVNQSDEIGLLNGALTTLLEGTERSYQDMITARTEAEKANSGKSLFIAKVSHELRTPIHGITGMLRILMKQESNSGKRSYIQMAQDSAKGLLETINEILDFSKMETGSLSLERVEFNLHDAIRTAVTHLVPRFEQKPEVELCWDIQPDVPEKVVGDPLRLKNVLTNLLGNAFKFTAAGNVSLVVSPYEVARNDIAGIRFEVSDTGIGIPSDRISDIFNPFTQADESTARLYAGTGLGLAIVKQIVDQMGGTVSARSTINKGSTFVIEAPFTIVSKKSSRSEARRTVPRSVAILSECSQGASLLAEGFSHYGASVRLFESEQPRSISAIIEAIDSFDLIHISGTNDILVDELTPLLTIAARRRIPVVMAVRPSEMAMTDKFGRFDTFYVTHKPVSAFDIMLIGAKKLAPSTSFAAEDDEQEKSEHQLKILVADDAATNRIILKNLLEEAGHSVELVENGQQLLDRIILSNKDLEHGRKSLDVVLTDIQMPVMDGLTATQHVRELEREHHTNRKLPIVAVTAYAFPEECTKMRASGIDHIITKPISPKSLSRLLSQITCEVVTERREIDEAEADIEVIQELCRLAEDFSRQEEEDPRRLRSEDDSEEGAVLDIPGVYERSGNSLRRTGLIFSGFMSSYAEALTKLRETALPPIEPVEYRRTVHSLKGLLLDVGAMSAAVLAGRIERQAVNEPHNVTVRDRDELVVQVEFIASLLHQLVAALPSLEVFAALPSLDEQAGLNS